MRIYSFMNVIKGYICTSYTAFLFVTMKNNFIKEIKHVQISENPRLNTEQINKTPRCSQGFSPARESSQTFPRFSPGYEGTEDMFYFLMINL